MERRLRRDCRWDHHRLRPLREACWRGSLLPPPMMARPPSRQRLQLPLPLHRLDHCPPDLEHSAR